MSEQIEETRSLSIKDFFPKNKPLREKQIYILNEIEKARNSGYKYIIIEAPTGIGKSWIASVSGFYYGSSYVVTGTKDLQEQYSNEFQYMKTIKGKSNYSCNLKDESLKFNSGYQCGSCTEYFSKIKKIDKTINYKECLHKNVNKRPCHTDYELFHTSEGKNICVYKTNVEDYTVENRNTINELITINPTAKRVYENIFNSDGSTIDKNLRLRAEGKESLKWSPCTYYHQLNEAFTATHSIFNYTNFILFNFIGKLEKRNVTIFDECHDIENQVISFQGLTLHKKDYDQLGISLPFRETVNEYLEVLKQVSLKLDLKIQELKAIASNQAKLKKLEFMELKEDTDRTIEFISSDLSNWIIAERKPLSKMIPHILESVTIKTLDISKLCRRLFQLSDTNIFMSATVLDSSFLCSLIGLNPKEVYSIKVDSDFPIENRKIYKVNIGQLNYQSLNNHIMRQKIISKINEIMDKYGDKKGIIHTTSYDQLNMILNGVSARNKDRLIITDPNIPREEIIKKHYNSKEPTVLISPSLHTG